MEAYNNWQSDYLIAAKLPKGVWLDELDLSNLGQYWGMGGKQAAIFQANTILAHYKKNIRVIDVRESEDWCFDWLVILRQEWEVQTNDKCKRSDGTVGRSIY